MGLLADRNPEKCLICQTDESKVHNSDLDGRRYSCEYCGDYAISGSAFAVIDGNQNIAEEFLKKAPFLAAERKLQGKGPFMINAGEHSRPWVDERDFLNDFPEDFEEKVQRSLLNIFKSFKPLQSYECVEDDKRLFFENEDEDAMAVVSALESLGHIKVSGRILNGFCFDLTLTFDGWKAARELNAQIEKRTQVFIAMWFDKETEAYRKATRKALKLAGYEASIVDEVKHNEFIMNKVLNMIKESHFVIADFSCIDEKIEDGKVKNGVRGGVYYEAGYAKGLGLEVIHTCNKDAFEKRLHFDVQQKNTIVWENDGGIIKTWGQDYIEYLKEHIIATVGKGPKYKS